MPTSTFQIPEELRNIKCSAPLAEDVCRDLLKYRTFIEVRKQAQAAVQPKDK